MLARVGTGMGDRSRRVHTTPRHAISECFTDKELIVRCYINSSVYLHLYLITQPGQLSLAVLQVGAVSASCWQCRWYLLLSLMGQQCTHS